MERVKNKGGKNKGKKVKSVKNEKYNIKDKKIVEKVNDKIREAKNREGLWRMKNQMGDIKINKYCGEYNRTNEGKTTHKTEGGWKCKRVCSTKSQWQYEEEKAERELQQSAKELCDRSVKNETRVIKTHEAVILYDKENEKADAYEADVERTSNDRNHIIVKIKCGRRKIRVITHEGIVENDELMQLAVKNKAFIYIIDAVEEEK